MRICLYTVTALPKLGGQEAVVDALARQFLQMGHEPTVLAPFPRRSIELNDAGLPYPMIRHPRFISTKHFVSWYRRFLSKAACSRRFEILHCHDVYPSGYLAALTKADLNIPVVLTSHGGDVREGNTRIVKPGMRPRFERAVKSADALISIGRFTTEGFLRLGADAAKIHEIPNGVDFSSVSEPAHRPDSLDPAIVAGQYIFFIGRIAKRKGLDLLIEAIALLPDENRVQLVIAGTGDEEREIDRLIVEKKLTMRVKRVGRVSGAMKAYLLQNAQATVMPSRDWEAFPLVVLESYAAGTPVIGTDIPGLQDLVRHEKTGLLVKPESPSALADAMVRVLADDAWRKTGGESAKSMAEGYDWKAIADRHISLYRQLIAH